MPTSSPLARLSQSGAEIFVPHGTDAAHALTRTTHLGIGAHPDDLEIMAIHGILECFASDERSFTGVVVTDGAGSHAPAGRDATSSDELSATRRDEQRRAASLGRYGAVAFLAHSSQAAKEPPATALVADLAALLRATRPEVVYTHNLADTHDTHVAVALRVIAACRSLEPDERPVRVIGCEVWRSLDWLAEADRVMMPLDDRDELQAALIAVFASQLEAGKRYDLAALGRRQANATFLEIRSADRHRGIVWGMDLSRAARGEVEPQELVSALLGRLGDDLAGRLRRF